MLQCQRCNSGRILDVNAHGRDCNHFALQLSTGEISEHEGYVPGELGVGCGDDVEFTVCLDCGQMQGDWPLPATALDRSAQCDISKHLLVPGM